MVEETLVKAFLELGTTGAFLVYLFVRNGKHDKSLSRIADTLDKVNESQERNTKVLLKIAMKHKLFHEADELINDK